MSCDCYRIGGPFIAEDPECPEHGFSARVRATPPSLYVVAFQRFGESLFNAGVSVHSSLEEACSLASLELDEPVQAVSANFDDRGRWLVSLDDVWCVIFKK